MLGRLHNVGNPSGDYVKEKLGYVPTEKDARYIGFYTAVSRGYVENALTVRVPFFGVAFDVNDLGLLSGLGFVIILLMLRFSIRNEIVSLRLGFKEAMAANEKNPTQLETFYHLLAMRMVVTLPDMENDIVPNWDKDTGVLQKISKLVYFGPLVIYTLIAAQDFITFWIGKELSGIRTYLLIAYTPLFWFTILALSIWCYQKMKKIDRIWIEYWKKIHPPSKTASGKFKARPDLHTGK